MPLSLREQVAHLLRRAGFGATPAELEAYTALGYDGAVERLVHYDTIPDDVDRKIGQPGYVPLLPAQQAANYYPNYQIQHARARWVFRMLYTARPLQEKMALFWHNHFATGWSKVAGDTRPQEATRLMAAVGAEDPAGQQGQIELFRRMALGRFADLLMEVTTDPAMLYWLDGRLNVKGTPQENYAREVMELFTMGVGNYTEEDVKTAARVFTGWNLRTARAGFITIANRQIRIAQHTFFYDTRQHDTGEKAFTFPIYESGSRPSVIPARAATAGIQDGLDFLAALLRHPATPSFLGAKLYRFFVNDSADPPASEVSAIAGWLRSTGYDMRAVMERLFKSDFFIAEASVGARYRWPIEHVVGLMKAYGPGTTPLVGVLAPLSEMGQDLYDPPSVEGYKGGTSWINSSTMLSRSNFGSTLGAARREALAAELAVSRLPTPEALVDAMLDRAGLGSLESAVRDQLVAYLTAGLRGPWTGATDQLRLKLPGLLHLIAGTGHFAFV
jgi:uncharacterized protein (DUF1800 family)